MYDHDVGETGKEEVKLTYQDQEGDWLLATDVPWGYFSNSCEL